MMAARWHEASTRESLPLRTHLEEKEEPQAYPVAEDPLFDIVHLPAQAIPHFRHGMRYGTLNHATHSTHVSDSEYLQS
jgi:hypothetical protein